MRPSPNSDARPWRSVSVSVLRAIGLVVAVMLLAACTVSNRVALPQQALCALPVEHGLGSWSSAPMSNSPSGSSSAQSLQPRLRALRLINYYPSTAPWTNMWTRWDPGLIDHDFGTAADLGANAVRIIVHPDSFGFPVPSQAAKCELSDAIALAARHGLAVQLTLFDWWNGYQDISGSDKWTASLLTPYRNDNRLAFVEVKNEVDPTDTSAMTWTRRQAPAIRALIGSVPVTVSVAGTTPLTQVRELKAALGASQPDFYDIHYYGSPGAARAVFEAARAAVAPYPLFVGETGASSDESGGETGQDQYLRTIEWAASNLGLPDAAPWILKDINPEDVPSAGHGDGADLNDGLLHADGSEKRAAASIRALFKNRNLSTDFNGDFATGVAGMPDNWNVSNLAGGMASWDPTTGHSSPGSVVLSQSGGTTTTPPAWTTTPIAQPTMAGQIFQLTTWAKGTNATGTNTIQITWFNINGDRTGTATSSALARGATGWRQLIVKSAAPKGTAYAVISLNSTANTGAVHYDDVVFSPIDSATASQDENLAGRTMATPEK